METYPEVTDARIDSAHWDLDCNKCKIARGFQLTKRAISGEQTNYSHFTQDYDAPVTYTFRCPVCKTFKQWLVYEFELKNDQGKLEYRRFRVTSIPSDGIEDIEELPVEPPALKTAYRQAIRAMDANANIAAAAMFRRALQVITRQLLGANPGNLANELKEVVGKRFNGGVITKDFANIAYIIKEAGNQGAHPDADQDLLDFTAEDANDLQEVFMEMVSELFIVPAAKEKARTEFLARRKVKQNSTEG